MISEFEHDVFVSFAHQDEAKVRPIFEVLQACGLRAFWSGSLSTADPHWFRKLEEALSGSKNFMVYMSPAAISSQWVRREWETFLECYNSSDPEHRNVFVLQDGSLDDDRVPPFLRRFNRPRSPEQLVAGVVSDTLTDLKFELAAEGEKLEKAREYYRRDRFWDRMAGGSSEGKPEVHIFTCGRGVPQREGNVRGRGGRTNIDMWDYQTVLDITHFFSSRYPGTTIRIEDPVGKLQGSDLEDPARMWQQLNWRQRMLNNKNCVIIGSPDVSDFSEILLAEIHGIPPYAENRVKEKGFVIIKAKKTSPGSFYWQKEPEEEEGVALIRDPDEPLYYPLRSPSGEGACGRMHGILVVARNPFCTPGASAWIVILSGFSGVATNAIAKLLTHKDCLSEFYRLDGEYTDLDRSIEALVAVDYTLESRITASDARRISKVTFERLVEI